MGAALASPSLLEAALHLASVIAEEVAKRPHIDRDHGVSEAMAEVDRTFSVVLTPELKATFLLAVEASVRAALIEHSPQRG